jgi:hypothetical protein
MNPENAFFDVAPRLVPADSETSVTIRPLYDHVRLDPAISYRVSCHPTEAAPDAHTWPHPTVYTLHAVDGALTVRHTFSGEQEYVLLVEALTEPVKKVGEFRLYALASDLFARIPFKGDVHMHSNYSDGREAPAFVAAACRREGLDFMAVTDHHLYPPSLEAQRAWDGVELGLRIYPGEEVHPPDNWVHIINFGGSFSVNARFAEQAYYDEVQALIARNGALPANVDPYAYASCCWCYDQIRAGGGLGVFCHPYWFTNQYYNVCGALTDHLFDTQPFDAYEVIGGYFIRQAESNTLQVARYHEERARSRQLPIVGVSDAHGCERGELFGWYYTIAFSPSTDLPDLIDSIKGLYSVAVEALPGQPMRAHGPFRLVKYAQFLMRELLPAHDALCRTEGELMLRYLAGEREAAAPLSALQGQVAAFWARQYASRR